MVRTEDLKDAKQEQKIEILAKKAKAKEAADNLKKLKQQLQSLLRELHAKENALIQAIYLQFPNAESTMVEKAKNRTFSGYDDTKTEEENKEGKLFAAALQNTIIESYPKRFEALHGQYLPEIEAIKKLIKEA